MASPVTAPFLVAVAILLATCELVGAAASEYDVVVYGCTVAGLAAAVQTVRMKKTVVLICQGAHLGGLTTSGLGWTDSKYGSAIGGIAREFYGKVYDHYKADSAWKKQKRSDYLGRTAQPGPAIDDKEHVQWTFEPHVAEGIWDDWMQHGKIPVFKNERIDRSGKGVDIEKGRIVSINTESGKQFKGSMFIDAGYEGDLMDAAGVPSSVGREGTKDYGEDLAGIRVDTDASAYAGVDPYVKKGDAGSGLLSGIERTVVKGDEGNGDADPVRLQSFNYRVSLSQDKENSVAFSKPATYNVDDFELLLRYAETTKQGGSGFLSNKGMPNLITDTNAAGGVSTDLLGGNYDTKKKVNYATASYDQRDDMIAKHRAYTSGFFYTMATNQRVPKATRDYFGAWGYAKDEFTDSKDHLPYEIYIREARRMRGNYVMTQLDVQKKTGGPKGDCVVGLGSYTMDVHESERVVVDGKIYNEGLVHQPIDAPFPIWYDSIIPDGNFTNFLNPVTMSSQSAATAAVLALDKGSTQGVDRRTLADRLKADKQITSV